MQGELFCPNKNLLKFKYIPFEISANFYMMLENRIESGFVTLKYLQIRGNIFQLLLGVPNANGV